MNRLNHDDTPAGAGKSAGIDGGKASDRPFVKANYIMIAVCVLLIVAGFALMAGPGSSVEGGFNPDIFSTRRIVVGPTVAFLGFLLMAFAIVYTPRRKKSGRDSGQ